MTDDLSHSKHPRIVRSRRAPPVLVCRKCLKRSDDGRDVRRALKAGVKAQAHDGMKPSKLVMTPCLGLCPKGAVVLASGASLTRREYVLVADGDQVPQALAMLDSG